MGGWFQVRGRRAKLASERRGGTKRAIPTTKRPGFGEPETVPNDLLPSSMLGPRRLEGKHLRREAIHGYFTCFRR
jgi:hypothetical protein